MENSRMILTDNIEYYMKKNDMQQADLVRKTSISRSSISKYLNHTSDPSLDKIDEIANAFGIPVSELFVNRLQEQYPTNEDRQFLALLHSSRDVAAIVKLLQRMDEWQVRSIRTIVDGLVKTKFGHKY